MSMRADLQNIKESYERNVLRENVDRLEFLKGKYLPLFYSKLLHIWPEESSLPSDYNAFKDKTEQNAKFKNYNDFLNETIDNLISADPYSKVDMEKGAGYAGQYSEWILKTFLKMFDEKGEGAGKTIQDLRRFLNEDLSLLNGDLKIYDKNKTKVTLNQMNVRDINQIKDFKQLYYIVKKFVPKYEEEGIRDKSKVRTLLDNSQYFVGVPLSMYASQTLGNNTRWCTSTRNNENNQHEYYSKQGPLYVVHLKTKPELTKFQFHFPSSQYMDSDNRPIKNVFDFFSKNPIVANVILEDYKKTDPKQENLRKAELITGGLSVLEKEPDQFFQNVSVYNITAMIEQGQVDMEKLNKGLKLLSDAYENEAEYFDGLKITFAKTERDEFLENLYGNDYSENILSQISKTALNPLISLFDGDPGENMVPYVLSPESGIFTSDQIRNIRRVYDDVGETPEESQEFYNICDKVLSKHLKPIASKYKKENIEQELKNNGVNFLNEKGKMSVIFSIDTVLTMYHDDDTTFFNILENPSYYVKLNELFPNLTQDQIEDEKTDFQDFVSKNINKEQVAKEILQKIDKK